MSHSSSPSISFAPSMSKTKIGSTIKNNATELNEIQSSIFQQISQISEFLAENAEDSHTDPCFQMLSSFFDIFNEQLKINFTLRNNLNLERSKNPVDPRKVDEMKVEIDGFLKDFNQLSGANIKSLNSIGPFLEKTLKKAKQFKLLNQKIAEKKKIISKLNDEIREKEKKLKKSENESEGTLKELQENIQMKQNQIQIYQKGIDELTPTVIKLRAYVENEVKTRENLTEIIQNRKNQIESTRSKFSQDQEKQRRKKEKLAIKLSRLKTERRQLLLDEQPLISALEEAENELQTVQKLANSELESISQQKSELEIQVSQIKEQIEIIQQQKDTILSNYQQKKQEVNEYSKKQQENTENIRIISAKIQQMEQAKKSLMKNDGKTPEKTDEEQLESLNESIKQLEETVEERTRQIEEMRKENSLIRSKIRVNNDKIYQLSEENQKLMASIQLSEKEYEKIKDDSNSQKQRYNLYKSTMAEYSRLRQGLGFHHSMDPIEVAKHTISMLRSWKQVEREDKIVPEKITISSINSEFENLYDQIIQVQARLNP
ncbi:hypothetical protein TRFO_26157 [Tritrichomonas foetus]|uniref:Uncharacterized protein n=1 Tax=Tritrichomonas foetus TaxID=1144522 RepID=A0A1J4K3C9_9EUKA|nr:hypothetical protein TRFO_26157 [Tritrichomonas foetus]|eukprot:OHT05945.1 hypothetical protein TRFO_26157 [Tritrichomonas foetus]